MDIITVGQLRQALSIYSETERIVLRAGGGAGAEQYFQVEGVGHSPSEVILNIGIEIPEPFIVRIDGIRTCSE